MNFKIENKTEPFNDFKRIANELINSNILLINKASYRFTSLEFYYFNKDEYADVYSHKHEYQTTTGKWYFHGSGLDITFGSDGIYGGILIRGLKRLSDSKFINGPLLCVQDIFNAIGNIDIENEVNFRVVAVAEEINTPFNKGEKVYYSRRVGLNPSIDNHLNFFDKRYRFFIDPEQTQKDKKDIAEDILEQAGSTENANKLIGYKYFKDTLYDNRSGN